MCGILGFVGKRFPGIEHGLARGLRHLAHRGPDDEGMEILPVGSDPDRCVMLGCRRLAVQDLSCAGHQPMHDPQSNNWLIFNGEIYNFRVIRSQLETLGHRFSSRGDTEVLLRAYGEWGEFCLERVRGMFALAVWEADRQRLVLVRDRLGIKPLYYSRFPEGLIFSSEVRALLASGLVPRRVSMDGLVSYLAFGAAQDPLTLVEGVRSLPPGSVLIWQEGKCEEKTYWSIAEVAGREPATDNAAEAARGVREILLEATSLQLISDVPLGLFLSGGIDSSSVLALATEVATNPLETFTVAFGEEGFTEAGCAETVARTFGSRHHRILLRQKDLFEELPQALESMDQPTVDGVNTYVVSKATKDAGVTVALSGLGGDEAFAGYSSFRRVPKMVRFRRYAAWTQPLWRSLGMIPSFLETNFWTKLWGLAAGNHWSTHPYFLSRALFLPESVRSLLQRFANFNGNDVHLSVPESLLQQAKGLDMVNQVSVLEASTYTSNTLLRDTDVMSMAHALEVRVPLLDHKLWEYVLPLRGRLKMNGGRSKPLLLQAVGPRLPKEIYLRRKVGFHLPFEYWLREDLRPQVEKELQGALEPEILPLGPTEVLAVWDAFLHHRTSWSRPWALFVLKQWVRRNIQGAA